MSWKKVSDEKPESGIHVLLLVQYGKNQLVTRGFFAKQGKFCVDDFDNAEDHEYDADQDHYYLKEGYYEDNLESENVYFVTHEVTHWMPFSLPNDNTVSKEEIGKIEKLANHFFLAENTANVFDFLEWLRKNGHQ